MQLIIQLNWFLHLKEILSLKWLVNRPNTFIASKSATFCESLEGKNETFINFCKHNEIKFFDLLRREVLDLEIWRPQQSEMQVHTQRCDSKKNQKRAFAAQNSNLFFPFLISDLHTVKQMSWQRDKYGEETHEVGKIIFK